MEGPIDFLVAQYGIDPSAVLNPEEYKRYRDMAMMDGRFETYIDYLVDKDPLRTPIASRRRRRAGR